MRTTDKVTQKIKIQQKIENRIYSYKMAAKNLNLNLQHEVFQQKWENHFH